MFFVTVSMYHVFYRFSGCGHSARYHDSIRNNISEYYRFIVLNFVTYFSEWFGYVFVNFLSYWFQYYQ